VAKWTKESISKELFDNSVDGYVSSSRVGQTVATMARRLFGGFKEACHYNGLKTMSERPENNQCIADNCSLKPRSAKAKYCETHYYRVRRNGSLDLKNKNTKWQVEGRYIRIKADSHPITNKDGWIYEHRYVLYNHIGAEGIECYLCGKSLNWANLHVDHVDCDIHNNNIANLKPSCPQCNMGRGIEKMKSTARKNGRTLELDGRQMCISEWAIELGITRQSILNRINSGWSMKDVLTKPKGSTGPKNKIKTIKERNQ